MTFGHAGGQGQLRQAGLRALGTQPSHDIRRPLHAPGRSDRPCGRPPRTCPYWACRRTLVDRGRLCFPHRLGQREVRRVRRRRQRHGVGDRRLVLRASGFGRAVGVVCRRLRWLQDDQAAIRATATVLTFRAIRIGVIDQPPNRVDARWSGPRRGLSPDILRCPAATGRRSTAAALGPLRRPPGRSPRQCPPVPPLTAGRRGSLWAASESTKTKPQRTTPAPPRRHHDPVPPSEPRHGHEDRPGA